VVRGDSVLFDGLDLLHCTTEQLRAVRGARIGFIFQDPMTSLNPVFTVGFQIMEPLREHMGLDKEAARKRAQELLELVGIPDAGQRLKDFPRNYSGGVAPGDVHEICGNLGYMRTRKKSLPFPLAFEADLRYIAAHARTAALPSPRNHPRRPRLHS
jgi:hypothetical protein